MFFESRGERSRYCGGIETQSGYVKTCEIWHENTYPIIYLIAFQLVDVSSMLPGLKRRSGLTKWRPCVDKVSMETYETYREYQNSELDTNLKTKLTEGHFPPQDVESLNLPFWYVPIILYDFLNC